MKIYNLFPLACGKITEWEEILNNIKYMGFDYIYINPFFETGYSKSLYAPKNFFNISDEIIDEFSDLTAEEQIKNFVKKSHELGIKVIFELIITHTAIDSDILIEHPEWYKYEISGDIKKFSYNGDKSLIEWGDLVELDNENPENKEEIWTYWKNLLNYYFDFGFDGVKIHSAYNAPIELLKKIVKEVKSRNDDFIVIADNLGANFYEIIDITNVGFDFMFTSFKWWDLKSPWFIEQHYKLKESVSLISFPENYDTERIAFKYNSNENASKIWYAVTAFINKGIMIPIGFETGSTRKLDEGGLFFEDLNEANLDIRDYIKKVNEIKQKYKIFNEDNTILFINLDNPNILLYKKISINKEEEVFIIANLNYENIELLKTNEFLRLIKDEKLEDISPIIENKFSVSNENITLNPGEIKILYLKK